MDGAPIETKHYFGIIIGPMRDEHTGSPRRTVRTSLHLPNIKTAIERLAPKIAEKRPGAVIQMRTAHDIEVGGITPGFIAMMDEADFAIADVSIRSRSTIYEVAILHALGTPVLFMDYSKVSTDPSPEFYTKDQKYIPISDFTIETIAEEIKDSIPSLLDVVDADQNCGDPISTYYRGVPLVEASGLVGVVNGQFFNFVRHIINGQNGAIVRSRGRYERLIIVEPSSLEQAGLVKAEISAIPGFESKVQVEALTAPSEAVTVDTIGKSIIDYPRPLTSLQTSPKYRAFSSRIQQDTSDAVLRFRHYEKKIIRRYMSTLRRFAAIENDAAPGLLHFMTVDEIKAAAEAGEL